MNIWLPDTLEERWPLLFNGFNKQKKPDRFLYQAFTTLSELKAEFGA